MSRPHLLVVGGGHASLPLLAHASALDADVTLLTDRPELWYSGMTPEWLGRVYTRGDVTVPLVPICAREGVRFVQGTAVVLDRAAREVGTADGQRLGYDLVAFDIGAVNPGDPGSAIPTKPLHQIEALGAVLDETAATQDARHLVIVGGGAAGVEVALNVTARPDLPRLRVTLVEPGDRLVAGLPARLGEWAVRTLGQRGAVVRLRAAVTGADDEGVALARGERLPADSVLWATGSVGPGLFADTGLATSEAGFARVSPGLQSTSDPRVFVAGDSASVAGHEGLARVGVHAVKQGPVLRENLSRAVRALHAGSVLDGLALRPFRPYPVAPLILSTGEPGAWLAAGPLAVHGRPLLRLKHAVDRRWVDRYRTPSVARYATRWDARAAAGGPAEVPRPHDAVPG